MQNKNEEIINTQENTLYSKKKVLDISYLAVCLIFVISLFMAFFLSSKYFSNAALIVEMIFTFISVPYVFGGLSSERYRTTAICSILLTFPFFANWISVFSAGEAFYSHGGLGEVLFFACVASIIITDVVLMLYVTGVIKTPNIAWIVPLVPALLVSAFIIVVFAFTKVVKPYVAFVVIIQAFMPNYTGFYVLMKDKILNNFREI